MKEQKLDLFTKSDMETIIASIEQHNEMELFVDSAIGLILAVVVAIIISEFYKKFIK